MNGELEKRLDEMQDLIIEATNSTPAVECMAEARSVTLSGESYPENSFEFFVPVLEWLQAALKDNQGGVTLNISLSYLNTSSIKCLIDMLEMLEDSHKAGAKVAVKWSYDEDNDRALEMAEEFREDITLPFDIVAVPIDT